jgi:DNA (cytosine-5)-methyltransferase 1
MKLLDLFCCGGGGAYGYHLAGATEIVGIDLDNRHRKNYPFQFIQADALEYLAAHGHEFDFIHASPPCQAYSSTSVLTTREHPELIEPVRELLQATGKPYCIENVIGAPLINPVELCGAMFGLETYRHRIFETSFLVRTPIHPRHIAKTVPLGALAYAHEYMQLVGCFSDVKRARKVLSTPWLTRDQISQCIPPAYTEYIFKEFLGLEEEIHLAPEQLFLQIF